MIYRIASKLSLRVFAFAVAVLIGVLVQARPASAEQRFILRTPAVLGGGANLAQLICSIAGCQVRYPLDGDLQQVFLVTTGDAVDPQAFVALLLRLPGVENAEIDRLVQALADGARQAPPGLSDREPVDLDGRPVWRGYAEQPAAHRVKVFEGQGATGSTGRFVKVAVIDTGVDPHHPVLAPYLVDGYDFTRNTPGGSERADVTNGSGGECEDVDQTQAEPALVNQSSMAVVDQSSMAVVDDPAHAAFGHGTMVAGVIHLVAPEAAIMPLKAFRSDGRGYNSDIIRAVYYAVKQNAKVLNMSFSFGEPSAELRRAAQRAMSRGSLVVASAGNNGEHAAMYPAAIPGVIGVPSTDESDVISSFSNYGEDLFCVAAPGEAVITTYPLGTYAAAWGTSFSAPFVAGTAALLAQMSPSMTQEGARSAISDALPIAGVACGRLDVLQALSEGDSPISNQP
jgi:subtilisin family serine protease